MQNSSIPQIKINQNTHVRVSLRVCIVETHGRASDKKE